MLLRAEGLFLIIVLGLLFFGLKRLPTSMRDLGKSRRILKAEAQALRDDVPLPPKRTIVVEPDDVAERPAAQGSQTQGSQTQGKQG
jgi:Sec-independent protein translocase protein TatA